MGNTEYSKTFNAATLPDKILLLSHLAPLVQTLVVIIVASSIGYGLLCGNKTRCLKINSIQKSPDI